MKMQVLSEIMLQNPALQNPPSLAKTDLPYIERQQIISLLDSIWDPLVTILLGPRQAGKTTLGRHLSQKIVEQGRYPACIYLNCDTVILREWLISATVIQDLQEEFGLERFILFIDEVQRLENPGLLIKQIIDLKFPIKLMVSGSSQLELKSKVQEHLTGRQITALILPLSYEEINQPLKSEEQLIYGCYPQIVLSREKKLLLSMLYQQYIEKDVIEILKVGQPLLMTKLLGLIAHSSGQLVNYQTLATDCQSTIPTIKNYLSILEASYVLQALYPFVGNKRQEITANPKYYFLDNGFRNQALGNFAELNARTDKGFLVESAVFQEIIKFRAQHFLDFKIHFWRTKSGAEMDFVLIHQEKIIAVEVKFQSFKEPKLSRSFRSFIDAYQPVQAWIITQDFTAKMQLGITEISFIPLRKLYRLFAALK